MIKKNDKLQAVDNPYSGCSFRDPAGFMCVDKDGSLMRQINQVATKDYDLFISSGLYKKLTETNKIVSHTELPNSKAVNSDICYKVIQPQKVQFISYPFEWSFTQLKDAALLTLSIQKIALKHGMSLKDASAYNIQFVNGKPIFIDTLSFEEYELGKPWQAYRQFCQHFLAPLALMAYVDPRFQQLSRVYIDGIPLDIARKLLPFKAKIMPGIAMHLSWHAKAQQSKASTHQAPARKLPLNNLLAIIGNLEKTVKKLNMPKQFTEWGDYYQNTNYSALAADKKAKLIKEFTKDLKLKSAIDLGGNNGEYSRVLNKQGVSTVCIDIDPMAVEANYLYVKKHSETSMLPLLVDLTNPGGALGWQNEERETVDSRLKADIAMALALIHHLAISNNLPMAEIARYFAKFAPYLIIEFVPKKDSQVKKLLSTRKDIFTDYNEAGMLKAFRRHYKLVKQQKIEQSDRTLYLFKTK